MAENEVSSEAVVVFLLKDDVKEGNNNIVEAVSCEYDKLVEAVPCEDDEGAKKLISVMDE